MEAVAELRSKLEALDHEVSPKLQTYSDRLGQIQAVLDRVAASSTNSWLGYQAELYYKEFEKPPINEIFSIEDGGVFKPIAQAWQPRAHQAIAQFAESQEEGLSLEELSKDVRIIARRAYDLRQEIATELSAITSQPGYEKEQELLRDMESMHWGTSGHVIISQARPKSMMSRDMKAVQGGIRPPPHVVYAAEVVATASKMNATADFIDRARRLLRQIEIRRNLTLQTPATLAGIDEVLRICNGFHLVARQMRSRHLGRPTLEIEDEYDVQDLLHALLKLFFDDVRGEEWTPSYAGKSARMDFLLKGARIVVEVKRTRPALADGEVGEQLILDVAKYQQHPDCGTLICFVYDPEGRIGNPRGLESDLAELSSERLNVIALVRPS